MELTNLLIDLIYPQRCPLCGKIASGICGQCRPKMRIIRAPYCFSCGKQLDMDSEEYCKDCRSTAHTYLRGRAFLQYKGEEKEAIHKIKYENKREYLKPLAEMMAETLEREIERWEIDVCVPIPMHPKKKRIRGFNQSEILAELLGKSWGIMVDKKLLRKRKETGEQKKLTAKERKDNLKDAFEAEDCTGKRILLIDDVYTTGSTIDAAAEVLKSAGAEEVFFACLCSGNGFN